MQLEIASLTQQGARAYNEDRLAHWSDGRHAICVVADGAGGHGGGDVAAELVCEAVVRAFAAAPSLEAEVLRAIVLRANEQILARQHEGGRLAQMRSTVVLAAFDLEAARMRWVHCGDSRAYLFRAQMIVARTTDHSVVQQMVASGMLDEEGARQHPQRNMLLSALGTGADEVEIEVSDPMRLEPGDALLLCSDGVWEPLGDDALHLALCASGSAAQWSSALGAAVAQRAKPEQDNYSAFVVWVNSEVDQITRILRGSADGDGT